MSIYEADIAALMHDYRPDMERILAELADHLPSSDLTAVSQIVAETSARIARFDEYHPEIQTPG